MARYFFAFSCVVMLALYGQPVLAQEAAPTSAPSAPIATPAAPPPAQTEQATPPTATAEQTKPAKKNRINEALAKIPPEKAQIFDTIMKKNIDTNRAKQQQLRSLYIDLRTNFVGPTFNKQDFLLKSQKARDLQNELRASLDTDLAEVASQFTQEERQIIFNALPARYTRDMMEE